MCRIEIAMLTNAQKLHTFDMFCKSGRSSLENRPVQEEANVGLFIEEEIGMWQNLQGCYILLHRS